MKWYKEIMEPTLYNFKTVHEELGLDTMDVFNELGERYSNDYFLTQYYNRRLKAIGSKKLFTTGVSTKYLEKPIF